MNGLLSTLTNNKDKILIVAGGGGGGAGSTYTATGGNGGGYCGTSGSGWGGGGGCQTSGGAAGVSPSTNGLQGQFGKGANGTNFSSGGGGGYYGGGSSAVTGEDAGGGGGGSGYIGNSLLTNKYMYCYNCTSANGVSTLTYTTTNVSSSPISKYAKSGNGAARITSLVISKMVNYNVAYGELPTPSREGYTFEGWYTAKDGGTKITDTSLVQIGDIHTLYAHWVNAK